MKRLLLLVSIGLMGCGDTAPKVKCTDDTQCTLPGSPGICVPGENVCAVVDHSCASGYRYDVTSGKGDCVAQAPPGDMAMNVGDDMSMVRPDMVYTGPDFSGLDLTTTPTDQGTVISSGTLQAGVSLTEAKYPSQVFAGQFNADTKLDLLIVHEEAYQAPTVELRLGAGNGTFAAGNTIWTGTTSTQTAYAYAVQADVNGDGKPDLIVSEKNAGVTSLIAKGDGTFATVAWATVGTGFTPGAVFAAGDLTGDKKADLFSISLKDVYTFVGDGAGQFTAAAHVANVDTGYPYNPHLADITADGKLDGVVASGPLLIWLPGDGTGMLGAKNSMTAAGTNQTVGDYALGQFDGTGTPDLLVEQVSTSVPGFVSVSLIPGTGTGTYGAVGAPKAIAKSVIAFTTADMDGNGALDGLWVSVDTTAASGQGLYVMLNSNAGLGNPTKYPINFSANTTSFQGSTGVTVGDFNADLIPDAVACGNAGASGGFGDAEFFAGQ